MYIIAFLWKIKTVLSTQDARVDFFAKAMQGCGYRVTRADRLSKGRQFSLTSPYIR
jgi:hypothetical protein